MKNIDSVIAKFLQAQKERLKQRTFRDYEGVMELFSIYLNSYSYQYLDEKEMEMWKGKYEEDENAYTKLFGIEKIDSGTYADFLEYFIIRKVASGESFMKNAVRVLKKFSNWLLDNDFIDKSQYSDLIEYFSEGKSKALPNAEKAGDLIYEQARRAPEREYEKVLEGYFTIAQIKSGRLWLDGIFGDESKIGPVKVTKQISDLCQEGWEVSLLIGMYKGEWYIMESGNVYPTN